MTLMRSDAEMLVLVDSNGAATGTANKLQSHHANTPLHLAFSCYVFNDSGKLLITQRATSKKVWPGVWTNSVCGHPVPGEPMIDAIIRRLEFELGMKGKDYRAILERYMYKTPPFNGIIENEFCPVYVARAVGEPKPRADEVAACSWIEWGEFVRRAEADTNNAWSWWCKDQLKLLKSDSTVASFVNAG